MVVVVVWACVAEMVLRAANVALFDFYGVVEESLTDLLCVYCGLCVY